MPKTGPKLTRNMFYDFMCNKKELAINVTVFLEFFITKTIKIYNNCSGMNDETNSIISKDTWTCLIIILTPYQKKTKELNCNIIARSFHN